MVYISESKYVGQIESQKERDHWEDQHVGGWTISNGS
jgi:hypothetical protein